MGEKVTYLSPHQLCYPRHFPSNQTIILHHALSCSESWCILFKFRVMRISVTLLRLHTFSVLRLWLAVASMVSYHIRSITESFVIHINLYGLYAICTRSTYRPIRSPNPFNLPLGSSIVRYVHMTSTTNMINSSFSLSYLNESYRLLCNLGYSSWSRISSRSWVGSLNSTHGEGREMRT